MVLEKPTSYVVKTSKQIVQASDFVSLKTDIKLLIICISVLEGTTIVYDVIEEGYLLKTAVGQRLSLEEHHNQV